MNKYSSAALKKLLDAELGQADIAEHRPRNACTNNQERALRAVSWIQAAEEAPASSPDARLIFSLIAFNALYAQRRGAKSAGEEAKDHVLIAEFVDEKLMPLDREKILLRYVRKEEREAVEEILASPYMFWGYWQEIGEGAKGGTASQWISWHGRDNQNFEKLLEDGDIATALKKIIYRVRVLRNQVLHGEAGFGDYYNRRQVGHCAKFMLGLTARMARIFLENMNRPDVNWGPVQCPPQGDNPDKESYIPENLKD